MVVLAILLVSCKKDETLSNQYLSINKNVLRQKYAPTPITIPAKTSEYDEFFHSYSNPDKILFRSAPAANTSSEMAITESSVAIDEIYEAVTLTFKRIPSRENPIVVSYTFPNYFVDTINIPSFSAMGQSLNKALQSPLFKGKQYLSLSIILSNFQIITN